jgi:hypothetical protein
MRVTQTRPRFNVPSERREHHQPQVIGRLIREKMSLPPPGLEPDSPALESSVLTTPPLARSVNILKGHYPLYTTLHKIVKITFKTTE